MTRSANAVITACLLLLGGMAISTAGAQPATDAERLVAALRQGGLVLVMRHASSPRELPTKDTADPANTKLERQLDDTGRASATAMGRAIRDLKIPIGEVLSSGTFRALQTVRLAQLGEPTIVAELGDGGQSMQATTGTQGAWLRARIAQIPKTGNAMLVTHMPNLSAAFPEWGAVADGEAVVVRPGATPMVVGRIRIEDWPKLK